MSIWTSVEWEWGTWKVLQNFWTQMSWSRQRAGKQFLVFFLPSPGHRMLEWPAVLRQHQAEFSSGCSAEWQQRDFDQRSMAWFLNLLWVLSQGWFNWQHLDTLPTARFFLEDRLRRNDGQHLLLHPQESFARKFCCFRCYFLYSSFVSRLATGNKGGNAIKQARFCLEALVSSHTACQITTLSRYLVEWCNACLANFLKSFFLSLIVMNVLYNAWKVVFCKYMLVCSICRTDNKLK